MNPTRRTALAAAAAAALPIRAAAAPPAPGWYAGTLGPVAGGGTVRVHLLLGAGRVERAVVEPLGMAAADVSGLRLDGGRIGGRLVVGHDPFGNNKSIPRLAARLPLDLDLTAAAGRLAGTFAGTWPKDARNPLTPVPVKGTVTAVCRDPAADALAPGAAWPCYLGPNANFSSGSCRSPLVADLNRARLVWASAYVGPPESGSKRYGACVGMPGAAGGASPLVADGKVFQFRYRPAGDVYQKHADDMLAGPHGEEFRQKMREAGWTEADLRRRWAIDADEELVCLHVATGRTLWTAAWPGEGLHLLDHKCSLTNHSGVVHRGRVYVLGALGVVRCVDLTGQTLWRAEVPGLAAAMAKMKADALTRRSLDAPSRSFCHALVASGNTVIAPDGSGRCGLVGLDADTGKVLWRVPGILGQQATPLPWAADGRAFVVAANEAGMVTLIDAASGAVAWSFGGAGDNGFTPLLAGDLLLAHKLKADERKALKSEPVPGATFSAPGENVGRVGCWRLTPKGPEERWVAPAAWGAPAYSPIGAATGEFACFRGNYAYHVVRAATGERVASAPLPVPVRWDEGLVLALPGRFVLNPDSQHGVTKFFPLDARPGASPGPLWLPPHPPATTYEVALAHAWADGRAFLRGADAVYCYDLREPG